MTHISVKKLEGDTWMVWNSLHYPAAGPRCDILADALYAHQIAPRYCSHRWRTHVIYIQCFFVSQLVLKIVPTDFWWSPKKLRKSEIPLRRCIIIFCIKTNKKKISFIKTAMRGNSKFSTLLLVQIFWINCNQFRRDFFRSAKNFSSSWIQSERKTFSEETASPSHRVRLCTKVRHLHKATYKLNYLVGYILYI